EIAHEMKKVQFLPSREQFFELRSHQLVAGNCTSEARSEAQLRYLDVNNVCSAPVGYRPITASEDNDLIRVCPGCKRKVLELEAAQPFIAALVAGTTQVRGLRRELPAHYVVIVVVRYDLIAKCLGGIPGHGIKLAGDRDAVLDLKELCRIFTFQT